MPRAHDVNLNEPCELLEQSTEVRARGLERPHPPPVSLLIASLLAAHEAQPFLVHLPQHARPTRLWVLLVDLCLEPLVTWPLGQAALVEGDALGHLIVEQHERSPAQAKFAHQLDVPMYRPAAWRS